MTPDPQMVERMTIYSSVVLVLAIVAVLVFSRTAEWRLLLIGMFMAIAASMQANIAGFSINSGQMALFDRGRLDDPGEDLRHPDALRHRHVAHVTGGSAGGRRGREGRPHVD